MPVAILAAAVAVAAFFAWANWSTRRNRWRTSKATFESKAAAFLAGTLTIESEPGEGTAISARVPAITPQQEA